MPEVPPLQIRTEYRLPGRWGWREFGWKHVEWAMQSHDQARDHAYRFDADKRLDEQYVKQALPVIETQLARAGVRLAALLNAAFSTQPQPAPHPY